MRSGYSRASIGLGPATHCSVDDESFVEDLQPEDEKEFTWFKEDVERARQLGKPHFAAWLERIARD